MARRPKKPPELGPEALARIAARFRALGEVTRLRILNRLMAGERSVAELVEETGLEQPNVSRHLAVLRAEGIVERRADGNRALYRIDDPTVIELCEVVCAGLADRLADTLDGLPDPEAWKGMNI